MTDPVVAGVGTSLADDEAAVLMVEAARQAGTDCGAPTLLAAVQQVWVPRGTWTYTDPGRLVADAIGAPGARTVLVDLGIPQQSLINQALAAITAGTVDVALVVGAEARAHEARLAKGSTAANLAGLRKVLGAERTGTAPDEHQLPSGEFMAPFEIAAGLVAPVEQYALMESALGFAEGHDLATHRAEIAALWAGFNAAAAGNPEAAFPEPKTADKLMELGPANRPLAFPYGKWHASQWTVDQGAAILLCSAAAAKRFGIPDDRLVHPLVGLESSFSVPLTKRRDLHRWPAMRVLGETAESRIGRPLATCHHTEVYSCFPVAVRVQQRELGLPLDAAPTITGGMAFAGGPFNSFVLQTTVAMVRRLREQPGTGLVTTVSGLLTKPGLAVWASEPDGVPPLIADLATEAAAATGTADVAESRDGPAAVVAATVTYAGLDPAAVITIAETAEGARVIDRSDDPELIATATTTGLVGHTLI